MAKIAEGQDRWEKIIQEVSKQLGVLRSQGIAPTLRTMHYRLVSMGVIGNTKNEYKELSRKTARAREKGILPIDCFVDQSRTVYNNEYRDDSELLKPEEYINNAISTLEIIDEGYASLELPKWYNQKHYVEIWLEKDALKSTFVKHLGGRKVRIVPNKGYSSLTFINSNCERLVGISQEEPDKEIHIRYFGDYDPSGDDMDRDIEERIERLTGGVLSIDFQRVAVKPEQIAEYHLPEMPTDAQSIQKYNNDVRTAAFEAKNGRRLAVELDALTVYASDALKQLVQDCVDEFYDEDIYNLEVGKRSTPAFKRRIRKMVHNRVQQFLEHHNIDTSESRGGGD
jgi:hypothetical protein